MKKPKCFICHKSVRVGQLAECDGCRAVLCPEHKRTRETCPNCNVDRWFYN